MSHDSRGDRVASNISVWQWKSYFFERAFSK